MNPMAMGPLLKVMTVMAAGGGGGGGGSTANNYTSYGGAYNYGAKKSAVKARPKKPAVKAPAKRAVTPKRPIVRATPRNPVRPSGNGGGGGGGYSSRNTNGVGSSSTGAVVPKVAAPVVPSDTDWLKTDSTYLQQSAALKKALQDYTLQQGQAKTGYETNYASDLNAWGTNQKAALGDLENDYASRGLLNSGLYADSLATTNNDWDQRKSALEQARMQYMQGLTSDLTNFTAQQGLTDTQARQEAAARKAAKYGIA